MLSLPWMWNHHRWRGNPQTLANAPRGTLPLPADPAAPRFGPAGPRNDAGTSASAASGTVNEFWVSISSSLIRSGYRRPGSTVTAKTSCTAASNHRNATTRPLLRSIAQTPQVRSSEAVDALLLQPLSAQQKLARLRDDSALDDSTRVEALKIARQLRIGEFGFDRLADMGARAGRWPEAAGGYAILASRSRPGEPARYLAALTRLRVDDLPGYRALCAAELDALGPSSEPNRANRVARNCVIGPANGLGPDSEAVVRLAESAVAGSSGPLLSAALYALGAALYRAGRYDAAILRLNESIATRDGPESGQDWAFLAMSHYRAGNGAQSRRWIEKLAGWKPSGDPLRFWDDIEVGLLREEALTLAAGPPSELPRDVFAR